MREHFLKTWLEPFAASWAELKPYEVRKNDRDYRVGDRLHLREFDPLTNVFTGRVVVADVTYITPGGVFGLPADLCVLGLRFVQFEWPMGTRKAVPHAA